MKQYRSTEIKIIEQGDVKITSDGYMLVGNDESVCFYFDVSERAYIMASGREDDCPCLWLYDTEEKPDEVPTHISFPEFKGWGFHSGGAGKTIAVSLHRYEDF